MASTLIGTQAVVIGVFFCLRLGRRGNAEYRMSVEVKGLAAIVRGAKDAIRVASDAADGMRASAAELTSTVAQVIGMKQELLHALEQHHHAYRVLVAALTGCQTGLAIVNYGVHAKI